ncbi:hypothetical protein ACWGQ5_15185 [Streptomyces sp. NPDC055722]
MSSERRVSSRMTEPLQFEEVDSPPRYATSTDKPVRYAAVADRHGTVLGYVWANDDDDAAGWKVRPAGGDEAFNMGALWVSKLHDAKVRGLAPTAALTEMIRESDPDKPSHIVSNSVKEAENLEIVKALAAQD